MGMHSSGPNVDGNDNSLRSKSRSDALNGGWGFNRHCIDGHFIGAALNETFCIVLVPDSAANRDRHEQIFAERRDFLETRPAPVRRCRHVEDYELVNVPAVQKPDPIHHRAYAATWVELLSFDCPVVVPQKDWNDALLEAH
jgi:hypothetical protein